MEVEIGVDQVYGYLLLFLVPKRVLSKILPNFLSNPERVVGIPVFLAKEALAPEIPNNLFQENEKPNFLPI